jgi:hypothetical protein
MGNSLVGTGHINKAAIISAAGDSTWATTAGFTVIPKCNLKAQPLQHRTPITSITTINSKGG